MSYDFVIYQDVPVVYEDKQGREFYGDVPCARLNEITGKFEVVDNHRGNAYAARHRMKYRKNRHRNRNENFHPSDQVS